MADTLKPYLAYSLTLHGAVLSAALLALRGPGLKSTPTYQIDFIGPSAGVSSAVSTPAPPASASADSKTAAPDSFSVSRKRSGPLPKPSLMRGLPDRTQPSEDTQPAAAASPAGGTPGSAGIATDMPNFPYPWYISQIRSSLWSQWSRQMPSHAGEALVVFTLLPTGRMVDLRIESSSGDPGFDLAAMASVKDAGPYPPLPRGFPEPFLKIHVTLKSGR